MIPSISFGQRFPLTTYRVYNNAKRKYENATLYKLDCKDESDFIDVKSTINLGLYNKQICSLMNVQRMYYATKSKLPTDIWNEYFDEKEDKPCCMFYVTKNEEGRTIGVCQTAPNGNGEIIEHIETNYDNYYKYVGQGMIASLRKIILKDNYNELAVFNPKNSAKEFYTEKCGFEFVSPNLLSLNRARMKELIDNFENKTRSEIAIY